HSPGLALRLQQSKMVCVCWCTQIVAALQHTSYRVRIKNDHGKAASKLSLTTPTARATVLSNTCFFDTLVAFLTSVSCASLVADRFPVPAVVVQVCM
ncbi:MAG: hypothetical protein ACPIOQ_41195, partial [Promethearchaeia archaeon]